jgi:selenocysteine lyase/cysteine desulfurase
MNLGDQRDLFEIPEGISYLNCAYMGPQLRGAREIGERAVSRKSRPWELTPEDFFAEAEEARELFARLVGGDADGVAIVPSVSYGMAVASNNVAVGEGEKILVLEYQFPSNVYPWRELAVERKAEIVTVPRPADHDWTTAVLDALDESVAVVTLPNCHWTDGSLVDLVRVGKRAKEVGAALVVDAIQSLGALPFDIAEVRPDFLVAGAYKWLLGPYGVGFMHVGEKYREGNPVEHNWINRRDSEVFARVAEYRDEFAPGARRYDVGERSNFVLLPMANEALRQILAWGVEKRRRDHRRADGSRREAGRQARHRGRTQRAAGAAHDRAKPRPRRPRRPGRPARSRRGLRQRPRRERAHLPAPVQHEHDVRRLFSGLERALRL